MYCLIESIKNQITIHSFVQIKFHPIIFIPKQLYLGVGYLLRQLENCVELKNLRKESIQRSAYIFHKSTYRCQKQSVAVHRKVFPHSPRNLFVNVKFTEYRPRFSPCPFSNIPQLIIIKSVLIWKRLCYRDFLYFITSDLKSELQLAWPQNVIST